MISVLLIDDETDHLETAKAYLEKTGSFSVEICQSAHAALSLLSSKKYDAVVSDYDMPVMTGLDLLKKLKAEGDATPFIMLTGTGPEHVVIEAFNSGAAYYLKKHHDPDEQFLELSHKIRLAVRKHRERRKLDLFVDVTRHDLLNKVSALSGYVEIIKANSSDQKILGYCAKQQLILTSIRDQVNFTEDYQNLGIQKPVWQDLEATIRHAVSMLPPDSVAPVCRGCYGVEVYADPLLVRVFYNLMDNSLRHGRSISAINYSCEEEAGGLVIRYEDDGIGITAKEKEEIFIKGRGKNTGLGLFLIREILTLTGISIKETGKHGKGARFDMMVPKEGYRAKNNGKTELGSP